MIGGKITTYRRLAEHVMEKLEPWVAGARGAWTGGSPLPGGDMPGADFETWFADFLRRHAWLPHAAALRLARAYGTRADEVLGGARCFEDLGGEIAAGLTPREVDYLRDREFAMTADDVLWRRSKIGLATGADVALRIDDVLAG